MTSLEFTQAQGLGYTRGMYRVSLSIQTYDSVIKVHGMVLASSPGHFPSPTWPIGAYDIVAYAYHQLYRYVCLIGSYQIATELLSCAILL